MDGGTGSTEEQGELGAKEPKAEKMKTIPEAENDKSISIPPTRLFPVHVDFPCPRCSWMGTDRMTAGLPPSLRLPFKEHRSGFDNIEKGRARQRGQTRTDDMLFLALPPCSPTSSPSSLSPY